MVDDTERSRSAGRRSEEADFAKTGKNLFSSARNRSIKIVAEEEEDAETEAEVKACAVREESEELDNEEE